MFYGNFGGENRDRFQQALKTIGEICGPVYANDNLIGLQRSAAFRQDQKFVDAFKAIAENNQERSLGWRLHTLVWAAQQALHLDGDFVECGVWKGFSFSIICRYLDFAKVDKALYLYDTYEGIPEEMNSENRNNEVYEKETENDIDAIYNAVKDRFSPYPNTRIVRGMVPDSFVQDCPEKISFLHLDMNSSASEIAALKVLFDRVVPGGMIVFDDYGWTGYSQQRIAEDEFMAERGYKILELPTGQGMVIKHPA